MEPSNYVRVLGRSSQDENLTENYTNRFVDTVRYVGLTKLVERKTNDEVGTLNLFLIN